jgi:hypothetical protein
MKTQARETVDEGTSDNLKETENQSDDNENNSQSDHKNSTDFPLKSSICKALHNCTMCLGTMHCEIGLMVLLIFLNHANVLQSLMTLILDIANVGFTCHIECLLI